MRQLIWKEWHEQRWKLGFGCIVLCAFALIGLRTRAVPDESIMVGTCALGILLLPILTAAGLIPAERGEGTLRTLLALPVAPWKVLAAKAILGAMLCAGPILAAAIVSLLMARGREISNGATWEIYGRAVAVALFLFAWMLWSTARSPSEGRAAALCVGVLILWLLATRGLIAESHPARNGMAESHAPFMLWAICPFVLVFPPADFAPMEALALQAVTVAALWLFALRAIKSGATEEQS